MLFDTAKCTVVHETLGQRLNLKVEDIRVHNPKSQIPKLHFRTIGRVTVLFRTDSKIGVSIMEYTNAEGHPMFDLAVYDYKSAREVFEELKSTDRIEEATQFIQLNNEWKLAEKLIELLS